VYIYIYIYIYIYVYFPADITYAVIFTDMVSRITEIHSKSFRAIFFKKTACLCLGVAVKGPKILELERSDSVGTDL
jgi:hypothetical protein